MPAWVPSRRNEAGKGHVSTPQLDLIVRFIVEGLVVALFALIGDGLKPKSFAGLFGAAPSVALATLSLTTFKDGKPYVALEARDLLLHPTVSN